MTDLLTIVIPCKNEEKYIGHLLDSLVCQHLGNTRIIIADAKSTDGTLSIIGRYTNKLNIEVIEGGPVSTARNNGAKLVKTPYILFIDADVRFFSPRAIYDSLHSMLEDRLDLITLNIKNYGKDPRATLLFNAFNSANKVLSKFSPFAIGAFFLTRRSVFEKLGGFPDKYPTSEDYILSRQYSPKKFRIVDHYFGQDERRFKKLGYVGMINYMLINFINMNNLRHFEKIKVNYWN